MSTNEQPQRVDRYEQFFGFGEAPFSLAPNPRFLFESASHTAALAQVAYAIERREPLVVITGEIGTGKTLLCRTVLQRIERKTFVSVINNPLLERDDLLKQLLQDFGVIAKDRTMTAMTRHDLVHALEDFLTSLIALQAHAVVIIDEAHHIQPDVLEQIRLLSNIDNERGTMLQIILVGQADLEALLSRPDLRQFRQRVSRRFRLEPLSVDELRLYVEHRLSVGRRVATRSKMSGVKELERALAEWEGTVAGVTFTDDAIQDLWQRSGGIARVVNVLCDRALEAACARGSRVIDAAAIDATAQAIEPPPPPETAPRPPRASADRQAVPAVFEALPAAAPSRGRRPLLLTTAAAVAAAALWFGVRAFIQPSDRQPVASPDAPASATRPPDERPLPPPAPESAGAPAAGSPAGPAAETTTPSAAAAGGSQAASDRFEIVVASFRTEARAASVADTVSGLSLPARRQSAGGWEQVISGPFASRAAVDDAQQRLSGAGLTQTVVVRLTPAAP